MNPPRPLFVILSGFVLVFAGMAYDITFAGIPYQDPSPGLQASYEAHSRFASRLTGIGIFVTSLGVVAAIVRFAIRRKTRRSGMAPTEIGST